MFCAVGDHYTGWASEDIDFVRHKFDVSLREVVGTVGNEVKVLKNSISEKTLTKLNK